jgi:hypothetical protein
MTTHTPGPWTAKPDDAAVIAFHFHGDIDEVVCSTAGQAIDAAFFSGIPGRAEANTRLIAAAPELLEALMVCRDCLLAVMPHADRVRDIAQQGIDAAHAAIAKATSE